MRGWSLAELARRSGVSKATISKIEREEVSPTAVILVRLAGAFDQTLAGLLLRAEGAGQRLSRVAEQPLWRDPETGYLRQQVFSRPDHPLELVEVELPAGQHAFDVLASIRCRHTTLGAVRFLEAMRARAAGAPPVAGAGERAASG